MLVLSRKTRSCPQLVGRRPARFSNFVVLDHRIYIYITYYYYYYYYCECTGRFFLKVVADSLG
jgi:hypothetical protein